MLISIEKIKDTFVLDESGDRIKDPTSSKGDFLTQEEVLDESIDVWSIKSLRPFKRNNRKHKDIPGDITVVYLNSTGKRETSEIHIVATHKIFEQEVNELRKGRTNNETL